MSFPAVWQCMLGGKLWGVVSQVYLPDPDNIQPSANIDTPATSATFHILVSEACELHMMIY